MQVWNKLRGRDTRFPVGCIVEVKLASRLGTVLVLVLESGNFVKGSFGTMVERILGNWSNHHHPDKTDWKLVLRDRKIDEVVQLVVARIEAGSEQHLPKTLPDRTAGDTLPYCWDHVDPFPDNFYIVARWK